MFDFNLKFPEDENPFDNFISDYELVKIIYTDKIIIKKENYLDKHINFLLNLSYDLEVEKNIIDIVENLKFDALITEDNKIAVPYQIEFNINQDDDKNIRLGGKVIVFWLKKNLSAFEVFNNEFIKTIELSDTAILYNIIENFKNWLEPPDKNLLLNWLQKQHEEKIILISDVYDFNNINEKSK